jgi:predicted cupin superfamily sugar epimerase
MFLSKEKKMKRFLEREIDASVELAKEEIPAEWLEECQENPERLFAFRGKIESNGNVSPLYYFFEDDQDCHYRQCNHKEVFHYRYGREYL